MPCSLTPFVPLHTIGTRPTLHLQSISQSISHVELAAPNYSPAVAAREPPGDTFVTCVTYVTRVTRVTYVTQLENRLARLWIVCVFVASVLLLGTSLYLAATVG